MYICILYVSVDNHETNNSNADENVGEEEPLLTAGGNVNWRCYYGNQYGDSLHTYAPHTQTHTNSNLNRITI